MTTTAPTTSPKAATPPPAKAPAPSKPRRDKRLIAIGVVLAVLCGLAALWAINRAGTPSSVVVITEDVAAGDKITAQDLGTTRVTGGEGLNTVPESQMRSLVGQRSTTDLPAGSLANENAFQSRVTARSGHAIVGVPLKSGQYPSTGLENGDSVRLVITTNNQAQGGSGSEAEVVDAIVLSVAEDDQNGRRVIDFSVPTGDAAKAASAASQEKVSVINVAPGGTGQTDSGS